MTRDQITFNMGTGEAGAEIRKILTDQQRRLAVSSASEALRIALRTLVKVKDKDIVRD